MDDETNKDTEYGRKLIKKTGHSYEEILQLFTVSTNSYNIGEHFASYHIYTPETKRERLFFLLILLSKLNEIEKYRTLDNTLGPDLDWLEKSAIIRDILETKMIIDMTGITFNIDIDEAVNLLYKEIKDSENWRDWEKSVLTINLAGIDKQVEEIREKICRNEKTKEQFREIEKTEGKEKVIEKIRNYLMETNQLEDVRQSRVNFSKLSREMAEEFGDPSQAEALRQRIININQNKELKKEDELPL